MARVWHGIDFLLTFDMQKEKIKNYFEKIKKAHDVYVKCSFEKQAEIFKAYSGIFEKLEELGVQREFSECLLIWGKEFLDSFKEEGKQGELI